MLQLIHLTTIDSNMQSGVPKYHFLHVCIICLPHVPVAISATLRESTQIGYVRNRNNDIRTNTYRRLCWIP